MNIANALIRLRDDLKEWIIYNMKELKKSIQESIPTKISEFENDKDYITETQLTLGVHTDGLIYIFKNEKPIGKGIKIDNAEAEEEEEAINLLNIGEIYLNQRYSKSGGGLVSDSTSVGMLCVIAPFESGSGFTHTLNFENLKSSLTASTNNTMFLLDVNKSNPVNVNGGNNFSIMTEGVTIFDNGASATVQFSGSSTAKYIVISLVVQSTELSSDNITDYIIELL